MAHLLTATDSGTPAPTSGIWPKHPRCPPRLSQDALKSCHNPHNPFRPYYRIGQRVPQSLSFPRNRHCRFVAPSLSTSRRFGAIYAKMCIRRISSFVGSRRHQNGGHQEAAGHPGDKHPPPDRTAAAMQWQRFSPKSRGRKKPLSHNGVLSATKVCLFLTFRGKFLGADHLPRLY